MKNLILILALLAPCFAKGQDNYTMKLLPQLQQSQWYDATNLPDAKITVGIPVISGVSFYVYNSGFTFHDVFHSVNDTAQSVNMGAIFNQLKPLNLVSAGASVQLLSFNYAQDNLSVGFSVSDKANFNFTYPAEFFQLMWYGNGHYMNQNIQIGNFGIDATYYREYAFHAAYKYKKWTIGFSPKILSGKTNIHTNETSVILNTDSNSFYNISATAKMNVQMSGIEDSADKSQGGYFSSYSKGEHYIVDNNNPGYAMDLGVKYEINDNLHVSAGVNNLGFIRWNNQVHTYSVDNQTFNFQGLHLDNFLQGDSSSLTGETFKDSIGNIIKFKETYSPYTTYLPYDLYLIGNYKVNQNLFGLELTARRFNGQFLYAGTASYQLKLGKHFTAALTYTLKSYSAFNIGGGIIVQFAGMQFYMVTDNWYAAVVPLDSKNANLNIGLNLVFGNRITKQTQEKVSVVEYSPTQ